MRKTSTTCALVVAAILCAVTNIQAAPISYVYTGSWQSFYSAPFGPNYQATLVMDNGGASAANQTYGFADFVSATLISGSYNVTVTPGDITAWHFDFMTNAGGQLNGGWFEANVGGDYWDFDNHFLIESFHAASGGAAGYFNDHFSAPGIPTNPGGNPPGTPVPEPASILLWSILGAAAYVGRRRVLPKRG